MKALVDDGPHRDILRFVRSRHAGRLGRPAEGWLVDPKEGDAFLDWGSHGVDSIRFFTGADAVRRYRLRQLPARISAVDPSAMV